DDPRPHDRRKETTILWFESRHPSQAVRSLLSLRAYRPSRGRYWRHFETIRVFAILGFEFETPKSPKVSTQILENSQFLEMLGKRASTITVALSKTSLSKIAVRIRRMEGYGMWRAPSNRYPEFTFVPKW